MILIVKRTNVKEITPANANTNHNSDKEANSICISLSNKMLIPKKEIGKYKSLTRKMNSPRFYYISQKLSIAAVKIEQMISLECLTRGQYNSKKH